MRMPMVDRDELHALLDDVIDDPTMTTRPERARALLAGLRDARQAHRAWVDSYLDEVLIRGLTGEIKRREDSRSTLLVATPKGAVTRKASRAVQALDDDGETCTQQKLIHEFTWDELAAYAELIARQLGDLGNTRRMVRKLAELQAKAPRSKGPADACRRLGTTVEDYLAAKEAAA